MSKSIPPQSLSWRIDVEPYPWDSIDALVADPDANPPSWLVGAMRAIEATA